jgi:hypothetical protein
MGSLSATTLDHSLHQHRTVYRRWIADWKPYSPPIHQSFWRIPHWSWSRWFLAPSLGGIIEFMDNVCLKNKNQMEHISLALAIISNHLHPCFWNTISALSDRRSQKAHPLPIPPTAGMSVRGRDIGRSCVCCILTSVARSSSDSLGDQVVFKKRPRNFIGIIYGFMPLEFDMVWLVHTVTTA